MDNLTQYSEIVKEFQNRLLEPMKQVQAMQNSFLKIMQPMQNNLSQIQTLCDSMYAPLQSLQSAFTANLQVQQFSKITSIASQLQNNCINPYIEELKSCSSILSLGAINPDFWNAKSAFNATSIAQDLAAQLTIPPIYSISSSVSKIRDSIIDSISGNFTPVALQLAEEFRKIPISSFDFSSDDTGTIQLSEPLEDKLSDIIDTESSLPSLQRKTMSKEFFYNVVLPIVLALLQLGYNVYSGNQLINILEKHDQEDITIQRQILDEERQQTEYLRKIAESSED